MSSRVSGSPPVKQSLLMPISENSSIIRMASSVESSSSLRRQISQYSHLKLHL